MTDNASPLVTFAVFAYNQKSYVEDAISAAFAQTYSPLQIILSDDCSVDGTYEIMQRAVESYVGPHQVKLFRNHRNLGLIEHVNQVVQRSAGELIVAAAGDDISIPERTHRIVEAYLASGRAANSIHSSAMAIDPEGREIGLFKSTFDFTSDRLNDVAVTMSYLVGATHAWTKRVFDVFGPIVERGAYEDLVIGFRSRLLGPVVYIDEPLVRYRVNIGLSFLRHVSRMDSVNLQLAVMSQRLRDYKTHSGGNELAVLKTAISGIEFKRFLLRREWHKLFREFTRRPALSGALARSVAKHLLDGRVMSAACTLRKRCLRRVVP